MMEIAPGGSQSWKLRVRVEEEFKRKWLWDDGVLLSSTDCLQARARLICSICRSRRTGPGSRLHVMAARIVPSRAGPAVGTQLPVGRPLVESLWMAYNRLSPRKPWLSRAQLPARNYPGPCQGGRCVIHPACESGGTRGAYEARTGGVGAAPAASR